MMLALLILILGAVVAVTFFAAGRASMRDEHDACVLDLADDLLDEGVHPDVVGRVLYGDAGQHEVL